MDEQTSAWDGVDIAGPSRPLLAGARTLSEPARRSQRARTRLWRTVARPGARRGCADRSRRPASDGHAVHVSRGCASGNRRSTTKSITLQDGKRFSSRHVRGSQSGGRIVCDANVSFATAIDSPEHMAPPAPDCGLDTDPESLPELSDIAGPEATDDRAHTRLLVSLARRHRLPRALRRRPAASRSEPTAHAVLDPDASTVAGRCRRCTRRLSPISRIIGSTSLAA